MALASSCTGAVLEPLRPVVPHVLALSVGGVPALSRRCLWGLRSIEVTSTSRLASLGACSGTGAVFALLRPVVTHALVLSSALSVGGVLGSGALQRFFWPTRLSPHLFRQVTFRLFRCSVLILLLEMIFQKTQNSKSTNTTIS